MKQNPPGDRTAAEWKMSIKRPAASGVSRRARHFFSYVWQFVFNRAFPVIFKGSDSLLGSTNRAMLALIIVSVWQFAGYMMLIYVAGFMSVSKTLMEAAQIHGCTQSQSTWYVTVPLMRSSFVQCLFLSITHCFMVYDVNLSLTKGEPFRSSVMAAMHVYNQAFTYKNYGTGQAQALILFVVWCQ